MARIVIDPGHYEGYNPGVCAGFYEGDRMLVLGKYLEQELLSRGADVAMTRTTGSENPSLAARGAMASGADLFIALHSDANDNNPNARGVTSYYSVQRPESEPFAAAIGRAVSNVMGNSFNGTIARESSTNPNLDYYGVIRSAVAVGAKNAFLIEHGYHTNQADCLLLSDDDVLRRIAVAEANVIQQYLNLGPSISCGVVYTVQPNDSLFLIAQKFGTTWQNLVAANNISAPYTLYVGDTLIIPVDYSNQNMYTVVSGDTLYTIAQKFGVSWNQIAQANNIKSPYTLMIGQQLVIPSDQCRFMYSVASGDSLYSMGQRFGVEWSDIARLNNLSAPYSLEIGQELAIPLPTA